MGIKRLPLIAERLTSAGRDPSEPAAVIERGTLPRSAHRGRHARRNRRARGGRGDPRRPRSRWWARWRSCARRSRGWSARPLHGEVVAVTRARAQASGLAARLRELGAEVVESAGDPDRAAPGRGGSASRDRRGPRIRPCLLHEPERRAPVLRRARPRCGAEAPRRPVAMRAPSPGHRAAIGPGTAAALLEHGIRADIVPERFVAEALVEALAGVELEGRRVLIARAAEARSVLPDALRERGARGRRTSRCTTRSPNRSTDAQRAGLARRRPT